jgi:hypothetical protein
MLAQGRGSLINTVSMSGLISNHLQPRVRLQRGQSRSIMLTKSLAGEWAGREFASIASRPATSTRQ